MRNLIILCVLSMVMAGCTDKPTKPNYQKRFDDYYLKNFDMEIYRMSLINHDKFDSADIVRVQTTLYLDSMSAMIDSMMAYRN